MALEVLLVSLTAGIYQMTRNMNHLDDDEHEGILVVGEKSKQQLRRRRSFASSQRVEQQQSRVVDKTWIVAMAAPPLDIGPLERALHLVQCDNLKNHEPKIKKCTAENCENDDEDDESSTLSKTTSSIPQPHPSTSTTTKACNVTLLIPWIEDSRERKKVYGSDSIRWDDGSLGRWQQTAFIRQWSREKLCMGDDVTDGLRIRFYPALTNDHTLMTANNGGEEVEEKHNKNKNKKNNGVVYCPVGMDVLQKLREEDMAATTTTTIKMTSSSFDHATTSSSYSASSSSSSFGSEEDEDEDAVMVTTTTTRIKIICMDLQGNEREFMFLEDDVLQPVATTNTEVLTMSNNDEDGDSTVCSEMYLHEHVTTNNGNYNMMINNNTHKLQSSPPVRVEMLRPYNQDSVVVGTAYAFSPAASSQARVVTTKRLIGASNTLFAFLQMVALNASISFGLFALWFVLIDEQYLVQFVSSS